MYCHQGTYIANALIFEIDANSTNNNNDDNGGDKDKDDDDDGFGGEDSKLLKMVFLARNVTLYSTGVLDLMVFGMQVMGDIFSGGGEFFFSPVLFFLSLFSYCHVFSIFTQPFSCRFAPFRLYCFLLLSL
jgi:hypothetical protein